MCKKFLREGQMSSEAVVARAKAWAHDLVARESRGPGDTENAMRRLGARYGIPYRLLWGLRYRPPKDLLASAYLAIARAYEAERDRQMRQLQHELQITTAKAGPASRLIRAAAALAGETMDD